MTRKQWNISPSYDVDVGEDLMEIKDPFFSKINRAVQSLINGKGNKYTPHSLWKKFCEYVNYIDDTSVVITSRSATRKMYAGEEEGRQQTQNERIRKEPLMISSFTLFAGIIDWLAFKHQNRKCGEMIAVCRLIEETIRRDLIKYATIGEYNKAMVNYMLKELDAMTEKEVLIDERYEQKVCKINDYENKIKEMLETSGTYTAILDGLIHVTAQIMVKQEQLYFEISSAEHCSILSTKSREGDVRQAINKKDTLYLEYSRQLMDNFKKLGIEVNVDNTNIGDDEFSKLLKAMNDE